MIITEGEFRNHGDGRVEASLTYVPYCEETDLLTPEIVDMIQEYDPDRECVLAIVDSAGKAFCLTLNAQEHMGSTPKQLFEETIKKQQHVPVVPGTLIRLKEPVHDIDPGWFVFLGEEKSDMILSRAAEDEDGDILPTDEIHRVHVDYRDAVEVTEILVPL